MKEGGRRKPPTTPSLTRHLCTITKQSLPSALVLSFALPSDWISSRTLPPRRALPSSTLSLSFTPLAVSFFFFFGPYLLSPAFHLLPATSPLTLLLLTVALATCCGKFLRHNTVLHSLRTCTITHIHRHTQTETRTSHNTHSSAHSQYIKNCSNTDRRATFRYKPKVFT